ncbi:MAG: S26 family signal peptidase [Thermoplasmata archaeon]
MALAIILLLLVALWAYTQNWPPMYVVESDSMQHGSVDQLGLINTGDLVLAQKVPTDQIITYAVGIQTGYQTYGEYGDVLLYHAKGVAGSTPIIHRAILYLTYNADTTYSFPSLSAAACGNQPNSVYTVSSTANGCGYSHVTGTLTLHHIGWRFVNVSVDLSAMGSHSGFLTMGDNNLNAGGPTQGVPDEPSLTSLVEPSWIEGVARGMLPWFGAIKLLLEGQASEVPSQSWQFMGITIIALLGGGFLVHYALRADHEDEEGGIGPEVDDDEEDHPRHRGLRLWRPKPTDEEEDEEAEAEERPAGHPRRSHPRLTSLLPRRGGRPRPVVKKGHGRHASRRHDEESDDADL